MQMALSCHSVLCALGEGAPQRGHRRCLCALGGRDRGSELKSPGECQAAAGTGRGRREQRAAVLPGAWEAWGGVSLGVRLGLCGALGWREVAGTCGGAGRGPGKGLGAWGEGGRAGAGGQAHR